MFVCFSFFRETKIKDFFKKQKNIAWCHDFGTQSAPDRVAARRPHRQSSAPPKRQTANRRARATMPVPVRPPSDAAAAAAGWLCCPNHEQTRAQRLRSMQREQSAQKKQMIRQRFPHFLETQGKHCRDSARLFFEIGL